MFVSLFLGANAFGDQLEKNLFMQWKVWILPLIGPSQMCSHQINKNILLKQSSRLLVFIVDAPVSECRNTQFLSMQ